MASRKPVVRTYVRKRKETAEEKFDAIIGHNADGILEDEDLSKRRRFSPVKKVNATSLKKTTTPTKKDTAAAKFDALFGSPEERIVGNSSKRALEVDSNAHDEYAFDSIDSGSIKKMSPNHETNEKSKYDIMFERNEKSASDKFDAMFEESEHIQKRKSVKKQQKWCTVGQSQVMKDLSHFNQWEELESDEYNDPSIELKSQASTKLPGITHASMVKVGGRVVLNIQRGGGTNSLIGKGGTLLVSPKKISSSQPLPKVSSDDGDGTKNRVLSEFDFFSDSEAVTHDSRPVSKQRKVSNIQNDSSRKPSKKYVTFSKNKAAKSKASYNSRPWASLTKDLAPLKESSSSLSSMQPTRTSSQRLDLTIQDEFSPDDAPKLKKATTWPKAVGESIKTSVKCDKGHQEYFTVVKHVKNYQNCLEEGETQEFEDEVTYLQEGLPSTQPVSIRCLSVTSLACKCEQQNFRLYLRAHNVLRSVFEELQDADQNKALALATASLLYMLSRDRQIDIDKVTLRILLKLVDPLDRNQPDQSATKGKDTATVKSKYSKIYERRKDLNVQMNNDDQEVVSVVNKIKGLIDRCGDPLVTSDDFLSTKVLASEALLRYTARRSTEWYREEIRLKGGLDHVINLVKIQVEILESFPPKLNCSCRPQKMRRPLCVLERLLRVLENGIINSPRNSTYLVTHQRAILLKKLTILMSKCLNWLHQTKEENDAAPETPPSPSIKSNVGTALKNALAQTIKLLVNISNDSEWSSTRIGDQDSLLQTIALCVLYLPSFMSKDHGYEIMLLSLGLMVNLVESSAKNRMAYMQMKLCIDNPEGKTEAKNTESSVSVVEALVKLFIDREMEAKDNEILGEEGVKRAAEAKRKQGLLPLKNDAVADDNGNDDDDDGYWVESEEGMEWVSVKSNKTDSSENDLPSSQGSHRFTGDPQNIEAKLTTQEKAEMKEALEKANDHMEASIIASYTALVLGCLIHGNKFNANAIRSQLKDGDLAPMISMLNKFLSFMNLTQGMSKKGEMTLSQVIEDMEGLNMKKFKPQT